MADAYPVMHDRIPPASLEAEGALLGAILVDPQMLDVAGELVAAEDFYAPMHGTIFAAIAALAERGAAVDRVGLAEELRRHGMLDKVGGMAYLSGLINTVPTTGSTAYYARVVREKSLLRALIGAAEEVAAAGYEGEGDVEGALARAESALVRATSRSVAAAPLEEPAAALDRLLERVQKRVVDRVVLSPWPTLNRLTGAFAEAELIVVPSAPSLGKTGLAITFSEYVAEVHGPVLFAGLEMGVDGINRRRLAQRANVSARAQKLGELDSEARQRLYVARRALADRPFYVVGKDHGRIASLVRKAREIVKRRGAPLAAIVVDHVLFLEDAKPRGRMTKNEALDETYMRLLDFAAQFSCPVFALIHLNRDGAKERPSFASLSQIRDGGNVEGHAHAAIFPWRSDPINNPAAAELVVVKSRDGAVGSIPMHFDGARALWCEARDGAPLAPWFDATYAPRATQQPLTRGSPRVGSVGPPEDDEEIPLPDPAELFG